MLLCLCILIFANLAQSALETEPTVQMRWDFNDCKQKGRLGPTQEQCDLAYKGTSLEGKVSLNQGIQEWIAPVSGLFLITAAAPSGLELVPNAYGRGARITAEFRIEKGEKFRILVGQQSDYNPTRGTSRGPGGSGGTFVTRSGDNFVMLVAGGGSSGAGRPARTLISHADADLKSTGKNGSKTFGSGDTAQGIGGKNGTGGARGSSNGISSSGGGAGVYGNGALNYFDVRALQGLPFPEPSVKYTNKGFGPSAPGVGGLFMFLDSNGEPIDNNGGFGGGGAGSSDGGAGGAGGYSGGAGGPPNGWGGGGGSINNGETIKPPTLHRGLGSVTVSFTGHACCGPIVVYIAMCFVAGIILTLLVGFLVFRCVRMCKDQEEDSQGCCTAILKQKKGFYSTFEAEKEAEEKKTKKRQKKKKQPKSYGQYTDDRQYTNKAYNNGYEGDPYEERRGDSYEDESR